MKTINNGNQVKSSKVFKEGDYWRWKIITTDGREYVDGGNFLTKAEAQKDLQNQYDKKIGRPPITNGDLTEKKSITLRASTWAKIEAKRQERESVSACLDRIVTEHFDYAKIEFWGDKKE